jgi:hypothetical protein
MRMEKKYVIRRRLLALIALFLITGWLMDLTTPKQCKVAVEKMSQACKDFEYPR